MNGEENREKRGKYNECVLSEKRERREREVLLPLHLRCNPYCMYLKGGSTNDAKGYEREGTTEIVGDGGLLMYFAEPIYDVGIR